FMPKPLFGDNGSGMHTHQSLWRGNTNLFYDSRGKYLLSPTCRHYIGGLLAHTPALMAIIAPTTNSYRRLVPGYEAPINLVYSQRNRSAICRIPMYFSSPKAKRVEFEEAARITNTPGSLPDVLDALEIDHEFLLKGDVFTPDLIEAYINYKRVEEIDPVRLRPHPHEFYLYFDI
ncbi:MAG: hypothetical protein HYR94_23410, partial [Chloroflexi bacterium]|nr:hypothetical protein [Chloroflexota bacterium]